MQDDTLTLRPAVHADLAALAALNAANEPDVGPADEEKLAWYVANAALVTVAWLPDALAGFVVVLEAGSEYASPNYRWFDERYDRFTYVDRVAVDHTVRRTGAGRRLYEHVIEHARATDSPRVVAEVNVAPRNDVSLAFNARMGFRTLAEVADPRYADRRVAMVELALTS